MRAQLGIIISQNDPDASIYGARPKGTTVDVTTDDAVCGCGICVGKKARNATAWPARQRQRHDGMFEIAQRVRVRRVSQPN